MAQKNKRTWAQANEYGQLGIIESVHLRNFMCHDNLSFEFDPHINFIIGRNGSGKSAVLTGIILALGGKSGATGRYSNIKGFIKTGKNSATVSVTLKNCGPDAYKPEEFGKKITCERSFSLDGNSSYKLKSEAGKIVSQSKEELLNILNVMDIQIDNPITVLTQETSRNFLLSKKPEKLFQLFYKGTGLAKVHDDYNRAVQLKNDAKMELLNKKAVLPEMEKDVRKLKSLLDKSSKLTELKKELLWAQVVEFEKKRDESQEAFDNVKNDITELEKRLHSYEAELANIGQLMTTAQANKRAASDKMEAIRTEFSDLDKQRVAVASGVREIQGKCSSHQREAKRFSSEIQSLEKIIDDIRLKNESDVNADKQRHEMAIQNLKNQILNANNHLQALQTQKNALRESYASTTKKIDNCQAELAEINFEKSRIAREKEQLVEGMNNRLHVFGREMVNVLKDIKSAVREGAFKKEPKGPIGLYITVKQPEEWNFAVQECLKKGLLRSFLCDNHDDAEVLSRILNKHYQKYRPSIITSQFVYKVHDVTPHKTVCEHPTVLDMLNIEDPVITNCLIDQASIENILLIADPGTALNLMLYNPPKKCKFAYTPNGDQYCHTPFRNYSCRNTNQVCMLKTVNKDDIRKKDEELRQLDQAYAEKLHEKGNLMQLIKSTEEEINNKDNEIAQFKFKMNQMHLKLQEEENNYEEPKDINCLHNDLVQLEKQKERHEECLSVCSQELQSKTVELNALINKIEELKKNLQEESQNYHALSEKVDELLNKKEKLETLISKYKGRIKDIEPKLKECEKELSNDIATVQAAVVSALDVGPRIDTRRSSDTIRQILKETEVFLQKQKNCDRQALLTEYEEKVQTLNKAKRELERQENINRRLDHMMAKRFLEFQKICKNTSVSLTCCFTGYLRDNNFSGYPDVNFEKHTLDIFVQPEKMGSRGVGTKHHNLSQLSGGERSYVTIALLLSLWDRIHMPFRILDEYDVFMDSNNRHLSIHQLIGAAKTNTRVQFIFLSPLELPSVGDSDNVKIHKMPAPRK